jgi:hypothetical protein
MEAEEDKALRLRIELKEMNAWQKRLINTK